MPFGEIVIGAPGAGKSTYAYGKYQLFAALERPIAIVNLDPANESLPYPCAISISSLITLQDAMNEFGLGPNGAMLYCMEYLEANFDWLLEELGKLHEETWIVFDLPGQVELSTNHDSLKNIITRLTKSNFRVSLFCSTTSRHSKTFTARRCQSLRCALCYRCSKIHLSPAALSTNDASAGTPACQRPFKD
jgi:GPN-loop GTPase